MFARIARPLVSAPTRRLEGCEHIGATGISALFTIWLFNIAMENGTFIDDFPIKTTIDRGFSMAMLNNQMVAPSETCQ